jgi:hypothetical protein
MRGSKGKPLGRITARPFGTTLLLWSRFAALAFTKVARLHSRLKFNVVHVHNLPDFLVFAALIPKVLGAQVVLHVQDVTPELMAAKSKGLFRSIAVPLAKVQERISTAFADHVVTVGWPFEEPLLRRGVPREKLSSVLNSADPSIFTVLYAASQFMQRSSECEHCQNPVDNPGQESTMFRWYCKAVERFSLVQYLLGEMYREGRGVSADPKAAYMWFRIAEKICATMKDRSHEAQLELERELTPKQLAEAAQEATNWLRRQQHLSCPKLQENKSLVA